MKKINLKDFFAPAGMVYLQCHRLTEARKAACHKGCSDCCRQVTPLGSILEAAMIVRALNLEKNRFVVGGIRQAITSLDDLYNKIVRNGPEEEFWERFDELSRQTKECPFLCNNMCAIYDYRPFACRAYISGAPFGCRGCPDNPLVSNQIFTEKRNDLYTQLLEIDDKFRSRVGFSQNDSQIGVLYRMINLRKEDSMATLVTPMGQIMIT